MMGVVAAGVDEVEDDVAAWCLLLLVLANCFGVVGVLPSVDVKDAVARLLRSILIVGWMVVDDPRAEEDAADEEVGSLTLE